MGGASARWDDWLCGVQGPGAGGARHVEVEKGKEEAMDIANGF